MLLESEGVGVPECDCVSEAAENDGVRVQEFDWLTVVDLLCDRVSDNESVTDGLTVKESLLEKLFDLLGEIAERLYELLRVSEGLREIEFVWLLLVVAEGDCENDFETDPVPENESEAKVIERDSDMLTVGEPVGVIVALLLLHEWLQETEGDRDSVGLPEPEQEGDSLCESDLEALPDDDLVRLQLAVPVQDNDADSERLEETTLFDKETETDTEALVEVVPE
eukprot:TRINITY_DN23201_c0_g1_i1.p2 TRINITY_DN23201_c0_g1~~TRINITY_DN23201_c0_g1_i1.p2  ORF type:complete len:224 (-),score=48.54 TRINITY_DN23201_c0_g1_i1:1098-1769(-)